MKSIINPKYNTIMTELEENEYKILKDQERQNLRSIRMRCIEQAVHQNTRLVDEKPADTIELAKKMFEFVKGADK